MLDRCLIIDEHSMISKTFLARLSRNLSVAKVKGAGGSFGGLNVIICRDFHQFPPVATAPSEALYYPVNPSRDTDERQLGRKIYEEFSTVVELTTQMRIEDPLWRSLLERLRNGKVGNEDLAMLRELVVRRDEDEMEEGTVLITPRHGVRDKWNHEALQQHCQRESEKVYKCVAEDTSKGRSLNIEERYACVSCKRCPSNGDRECGDGA